jgi:predicted AlkP superfamily phosphohydrolase/phosphomutase
MLRRVIVSAALASSLFAADVVLLTLFLNPDATLAREALPLARALFVPYAVVGTALLSLLVLAWTIVRGSSDAPRPPLPGLPWFTPLALIAVAAAAALFWLNLLSYHYSIPDELVRAVAASALALTASALVLLAVQIDALLFPLRGRAAAAALVVLAASAAVVVPLAVRPARAPSPAPVPLATESIEPSRRIVLIGIDGIGPDQLRDLISRGVLPAFAQLLRRGAHGPLATLRPTEGPPIWTTILTGRLPRDHGIKSFTTYRLAGSPEVFELLPKGALIGLLERTGLVTRSAVTAASRKRRALWDILNAFGIPTGTVRVWGTHPPQSVQGFALSPYFHLLRHEAARAGEALHPPDLLREVTARGVEAEDVERTMLSRFVDVQAQMPADAAVWRRELVERALVPDITYERAGAVLRQAYDPPFFVMCYQGLDVVGHAFTRFARPERFGDVSGVEVRRYGAVVDRYAAYVSERVGETAAGLRPGEILLVVSGYGMETVRLWRRALSGLAGERPVPSGTHAGAPDGFLLAVGDGIKPGAELKSASVLDVAPTILYLMGLPVARDMEGRVLGEIVEEDFARAHPVSFIPSYESLAVTAPRPSGSDLPPLPDEVP